MDKKVILITGGSSGLGKEFVRRISASSEYIIYFTGTKNLESETRESNVIPIRCDLRDEAEIFNCVSKIYNEQGKIDVLVNNACPMFKPCDFLTSDWYLFQELIDVNVKGAYLFTREASKIMKSQEQGKIINILSSYVINVPPEKISFYITAKYALLGLSKAAAAELCKYGITVNMISPGIMSTQLTSYLPKKYMEAYAGKHPMKRMTTTSDVAGVLDFLISDNSSFLNGINIPVNGGESFSG